jgi:hypothetical protein
MPGRLFDLLRCFWLLLALSLLRNPHQTQASDVWQGNIVNVPDGVPLEAATPEGHVERVRLFATTVPYPHAIASAVQEGLPRGVTDGEI